MGVAHPQEAEFTGQRLHLRILGDHRHRGELLRRHGLQGVPDQRPAVKNRRQLVLSKAPGVRERGAEYLRLLVVDYNRPAIRLYEKCGFRRAGGAFGQPRERFKRSVYG